MTITVSVEELRKYESEMKRWHDTRAAVCFKAMKDSGTFGRYRHDSFEVDGDYAKPSKDVQSKLDAFEKDFPKPILIPAV